MGGCIKLPLVQSKETDLNLVQTKWKALIDPVLGNQLVEGHLLKNISLINGVTSVNHLLGRNLQGWFIVGVNGPAQIYDNQASNQHQNLTLSLTSNASVMVNLWVF